MTYKKSYSRSGSYRGYRPKRLSSSCYLNKQKRSSGHLYRSSGLSTRTKNGYAQYYDRYSGSWKFTHRRVAEKKLGGGIRDGYEVHHINQNKRYNRPSNLRVLSRFTYRAIHRKSRPKKYIFRWWKK